jgi:TRAP-type C4-dicarboxylate transport system permease large subunit
VACQRGVADLRAKGMTVIDNVDKSKFVAALGLIPFVLVVLACLMVVTYVPALSLTLRDLVYAT